jgi:DNA-directed RNA polymerase subunit N (RpoN/RPB10)
MVLIKGIVMRGIVIIYEALKRVDEAYNSLSQLGMDRVCSILKSPNIATVMHALLVMEQMLSNEKYRKNVIDCLPLEKICCLLESKAGTQTEEALTLLKKGLEVVKHLITVIHFNRTIQILKLSSLAQG